MTWIQWLSVGLSFLAMFFCLRRWCIRPEKKLLRVPVLLLLVHFIIFYGYQHLIDREVITNYPFWANLDSMMWSSVLRLHSVFTVLILEIYGYGRDLRWMRIQ